MMSPPCRRGFHDDVTRKLLPWNSSFNGRAVRSGTALNGRGTAPRDAAFTPVDPTQYRTAPDPV